MKKSIDECEMLVNFCNKHVNVVMIFRTDDNKTEFLYVNEKGILKSKKISLSEKSHKVFLNTYVRHSEILQRKTHFV